MTETIKLIDQNLLIVKYTWKLWILHLQKYCARIHMYIHIFAYIKALGLFWQREGYASEILVNLSTCM